MSDSFAAPWTSSPPGSSVHGVSQARILEQIAILFFRSSSLPRDRTHVFCTCRQILYHWATRDFNIFSSKCFLQNLSFLIMCWLGSFWLGKPKPMKPEEEEGLEWPGWPWGITVWAARGLGLRKGQEPGPANISPGLLSLPRKRFPRLQEKSPSFVS